MTGVREPGIGSVGASAGPPPGAGRAAGERPDPEAASVGELIGNVSRDLTALVRQELALARAELRDEVTRAGRGGGALGAAVLTAHLSATALSVALGLWVARDWPPEAAALVVAVVWAALTAVLWWQGTRLLRELKERAGGSRRSDTPAGTGAAPTGRRRR